MYSCFTPYINKIWGNHAHTGCTGFKMYAPSSQNVHTGCRVHCYFRTLTPIDVTGEKGVIG